MKDASKAARYTGIRARLKSLAFYLVIFLIFLGALEVILRTTHLFGARPSWVQPDPILGSRHIPGARYWERKENPRPISGRINSHGWRDKEWSESKPEGTYRIAVLGDSMVEAFQVESDKTFLVLAEQRLNDKGGPNVELMNFGRSSCCPTEELLILKHDAYKFSPDMVVLLFVPDNDIRDVCRDTAQPVPRPFYDVAPSGELTLDTSFTETRGYRLRCLVNWPKQHSALIGLLADRYNAFRQRELAVENRDLKSSYLSLCTANPDSKSLRNYKLCKTLIEAIAEECSERGIRFVLVSMNSPSYDPDTEQEFRSIEPTFDANYFEDDLGAFAARIGIDYLGLDRLTRDAYMSNDVQLHWGTWGHWNYEGHEVVAKALAAKLEPIVHGDRGGD